MFVSREDGFREEGRRDDERGRTGARGWQGKGGPWTLIRGMENCRGEGGSEREPGLGEILRGLRAMARVNRTRICMCACMRAHVCACCAYTHVHCVHARITLWAGGRGCACVHACEKV